MVACLISTSSCKCYPSLPSDDKPTFDPLVIESTLLESHIAFLGDITTSEIKCGVRQQWRIYRVLELLTSWPSRSLQQLIWHQIAESVVAVLVVVAQAIAVAVQEALD